MVPRFVYSVLMAKRIAIVGSGISGSLCARLLATQHHVTLFEAADRLGGHTYTLDVEAFGKTWPVDTGFMVFNERTYPNFVRMLELLGIESQPSDMSFSVHCSRTGLEYQGSSLNGLFAQRRNLMRPGFWAMLGEILRFNREAHRLLETEYSELPIGKYFSDHRYSAAFTEQYFLPMTAAIWSAPPREMLTVPAKFLVQFLQNHGLLQIFDRPQWRTIPGGAKRYLEALLHPLGDAVRTSSRITAVRRDRDGVRIQVSGGEHLGFDAVVLASHAPQSLAMLKDATSLEQEVLGAFRYQSNEAYLHLDEAMLPSRPRAWASWNYRLAGDPSLPASVTYDLSRLQHHETPTPILQTLNPVEPLEPAKILSTLQFEHPLFDARTYAAQQKHDQLHQNDNVFFCGAYWSYGFHEDGVLSALKVCQRFGIELEQLTQPCIVASTKAESLT